MIPEEEKKAKRRAYDKQYWQNNKEKRIAQNKVWKEKNKEKYRDRRREYQRKYHKSAKSKIWRKEYHIKNIAIQREYDRLWKMEQRITAPDKQKNAARKRYWKDPEKKRADHRISYSRHAEKYSRKQMEKYHTKKHDLEWYVHYQGCQAAATARRDDAGLEEIEDARYLAEIKAILRRKKPV